jgi:hypothetical protein
MVVDTIDVCYFQETTMSSEKIHLFDENGEYIESVPGVPDALEPGKVLIPVNGTCWPVLDERPGFARVYDGNLWNYIEDHRGECRYSTRLENLGEKVTIDKIGPLIEVAADTTAAPPPVADEGYRTIWTGKEWGFEQLPPPEEVSMRQARLALLSIGKLIAVNAAIAAMPGPEGEAARIEWEFAQSVSRNNPLLKALSNQMEITDEMLDNLFRAAGKL